MNPAIEDPKFPFHWPALDEEMHRSCRRPEDAEFFADGVIASVKFIYPQIASVAVASRLAAVRRWKAMLDVDDVTYFVERFFERCNPQQRLYIAGRLAGYTYDEIIEQLPEVEFSKRMTLKKSMQDKWKRWGHGNNKAWMSGIQGSGVTLPTKRNWRKWVPHD